jgi:predicted nucleic acid-binding Zn ribbon protein
MGKTGDFMSKLDRAARTKGRQVKKRSGPTPVGVAVSELASTLGISRALREYDVINAWDAVVGERVARVTRVQRVSNGRLFVEVSSAPWRAELAMRRTEIIEKLNKRVHGNVVKDIRFR